MHKLYQWETEAKLEKTSLTRIISCFIKILHKLEPTVHYVSIWESSAWKNLGPHERDPDLASK